MPLVKDIRRRVAQIYRHHTHHTHRRSPVKGQTHSGCFFNRLPYDIRFAVYSYLEPDLALAPHKDCLGFIMSCHQAKEEIEDLARGNLGSICATIEELCGVRATIEIDPHNQRNITVGLPFAAFDDSSIPSLDARWKRCILVNLHPLFAHPFDMMRIHVAGDYGPNPNVAKHEATARSTELECTMRSLTRGIGTMIDHVNFFTQLDVYQQHGRQHYLERLEQIFSPHPDKTVPPYPTEVVRAKRICLTWDLRDTPGSSKAYIFGATWHTISIFVHPGRRSFYHFDDTRASLARWRKAKKEKKINPLDPPNLYESIYYHLHDAEYSMGEIGVASPTRWMLHIWSGQSVARLVDEHNGNSTRREVSSMGPGGVVAYRTKAKLPGGR